MKCRESYCSCATPSNDKVIGTCQLRLAQLALLIVLNQVRSDDN
jgi:hypothetical protein